MDTLTTFEKIYGRPARGGAEVDIFSRSYRKVHTLNHREPSRAKARYSRRTRRQANQAIRTYA